VKRDARDREFSRMIRERDWYTCQRCGAMHKTNSQGLHCAHMFSRGKLGTRWDPENAVALCYGCHRYLDTHPDLKREFFLARLGVERFEALELRSNRTKVSR
jgi:5-methylcytosine-specific restriction endonuclease McrA